MLTIYFREAEGPPFLLKAGTIFTLFTCRFSTLYATGRSSNAASAQEFIKVNVELNQQYGECKRWIPADKDGKKIGRIAAFVNKK